MYVIIYNQDNNIPAVLSPSPEVVEALGGGIEAVRKIAIKDVPSGKPFKILDHTELPQDVPQEVWVVKDEDLTDGIGGETNKFTNDDLEVLYEKGVIL